jgi:transcriptional regulator with XRE-family HTH domain
VPELAVKRGLYEAESRKLTARLYAERRRRGWPRQRVADAAGVTEAAIRMWEKGDRHPTARYLLAWAAALGFDVLVQRRTDE